MKLAGIVLTSQFAGRQRKQQPPIGKSPAALQDMQELVDRSGRNFFFSSDRTTGSETEAGKVRKRYLSLSQSTKGDDSLFLVVLFSVIRIYFSVWMLSSCKWLGMHIANYYAAGLYEKLYEPFYILIC